jgi:hypothetical protein
MTLIGIDPCILQMSTVDSSSYSGEKSESRIATGTKNAKDRKG